MWTKQIRSFNFANRGLTDEGLKGIGHLSNLQTLRLDDNRLTAKCVKHLMRLPKLQNLYLERIRMDEEFLLALADISTLNYLFIYGCDLPPEVIRKFKRLRPTVVVCS